MKKFFLHWFVKFDECNNPATTRVMSCNNTYLWCHKDVF